MIFKCCEVPSPALSLTVQSIISFTNPLEDTQFIGVFISFFSTLKKRKNKHSNSYGEPRPAYVFQSGKLLQTVS